MPLDPLSDPLLRAPRSHVPTIPAMTEAAAAATPEQLADFVAAIGAAGGGGGGGGGGNATNLGVVASPTGVAVTSDTGTDAVLPLADGTDAGLMAPAQHTKLAGVAAGATANATDAQLRDRSTHTGAQAISTVTGLQAALDGKAALVGGKLDPSQVPDIALQQYLGAVANEAAMLALAGQLGDWCTRSDTGTDWRIVGNPATLAGWLQTAYPSAPVVSVAGKTGAVTLAKGDVGLGNVDNTSDANKPVSTAQAEAIGAKMNATMPALQSVFDGGTAAQRAAFSASVSGDAVGPLGRKLIAAYSRVSGQNAHDLGVMSSPPSVSNVQTDPNPKRQTGFWATNGRSQFKVRGVTSDAFLVQYFINVLRVNSCRTASATYQNATSGFTVEFVTDAPSFSVELNSAGTEPVWLAVGNPNMTGMQMTNADGHTTSYALTIDWAGVRKMRGYRFYMGQAHGFGRINIGASDTLYRPRYYEPRILDIGDSITALALSPASGGPIYGYTSAAREISGCDVIGHGIAGSGYLTGNLATNQYRIDDAALARADLIRLNLGINDNGQSAAAIQAACTTVLSGLRALMPFTPIEVKGPFGGNTNASASILAIESGLSAAVAAIADSRIAFTPALTASDENWPELLGTTDTDTSAGVAGNSGIMTGNDGTHPSRSGGVYLARRRHEASIETVIRMGW